MPQTQGIGTTSDLAALRAQYGASTGKPTHTGDGAAPEQPAPPTSESYGGRVSQFVRQHPRLSTAGAAVAAASLATRTNPVRWLGDRLSTTAKTVAGAMIGGIGAWVALHAGGDALASVAQAVNVGAGLIDTAVAVGLVAIGGWAGRSQAQYRIAQRDQVTASTQAAKSEGSSGIAQSLPRATALVLAGAALPHIINKIKNH